MFVIELLYTATLEEIDRRMSAHVAFLKKYYAAGNFLVSGRKIPRDGGIILAVGQSRQEIDAIIGRIPSSRKALPSSGSSSSAPPSAPTISRNASSADCVHSDDDDLVAVLFTLVNSQAGDREIDDFVTVQRCRPG